MPDRCFTCALASCLLAGCVIAPVDTERGPPPDWPELQVHVSVTDRDLASLCRLQSGLSPLIGCAMVDFNRRSCTVYLRFESPAVLEHERLHCLGYDHPAEATLRNAWEAFKRAPENRGEARTVSSGAR
jgi:hypothetical protein